MEIREGISVAATGMLFAICAVPALPGATKMLSIFSLRDNFQTIACSLAPLPITKAFRLIPAPI
jgi:hypothetical protein